MPLVYQQNINEASRLAVWHIIEPEQFFQGKIMLPRHITHPHKRLQHLAGRFLLTELFEKFPLELIMIADTRKPFLPNEAFHFSISHCGNYAAAIVSKSNRVGVDIEVISEKTLRIKDKFLSQEEQELIRTVLKPVEHQPSTFYHQAFTLAWSIKETIFKWVGEGAIDFKEHLIIDRVEQQDNQFIAHCIYRKNEPVHLKVNGLYFNGNFLTWTLS